MESLCKLSMWLVVFLFICPGPADASFTKGQALEIINGYSLKVLTDDGTRVVRLAEIISPSTIFRTFPCKNEAKQFLQEITFGKELTFVFWATDGARRSVCKVYLPDGTDISALMVSKGYAVQDQHYSSSTELSHLEESAMLNKLGVWEFIAHNKL